MNKKFLINNKEYSINTIKQNDNFFVKINGIKKTARLMQFESTTNTLFIEIDNIIYKFQIDASNKSKTIVHIFNINKNIQVQFSNFSKTFLPAAPTSFMSNFKYELKSPISGRIIKINVNTGDKIKKNQPLFIIESMKMENEILAECDAFIKTIQINESDLVKQNQIIMTFEERENNNAKTKNTNEKKKVSNRRISKKIKT